MRSLKLFSLRRRFLIGLACTTMAFPVWAMTPASKEGDEASPQLEAVIEAMIKANGATPKAQTPPSKPEGAGNDARAWVAAIAKERAYDYARVERLPKPNQWPTLKAAIEEQSALSAKKRDGLNVLANLLTHNVAGLEAYLAQAAGKQDDRETNRLRRELALWLAYYKADRDQLLAALLDQLQDESSEVRVPDLLAMVGEEKARAFLTKALSTYPGKLEFDYAGRRTVELAREIALERIDDLPQPPWVLTHSLDPRAAKLYEGLAKRKFGKDDSSQSYERGVADEFYLFGFVAAGQTDKALQWLERRGTKSLTAISYTVRDALSEAGKSKELFAFLEEFLSRDPRPDLWNMLIKSAAESGQSARVPALLRKALESPQGQQSNQLSGYLIDALLGDDQVEEGITLLQQRLATLQERPGLVSESQWSEQQTLATQLLRLGAVLQRPELVASAKEPLFAALFAQAQRVNTERFEIGSGLVELLCENGLGAELEAVLCERIKHLVALDPSKEVKAADDSLARYEADRKQQHQREQLSLTLKELLALYYLTDRPADALALLERTPFWAHRDVAGMLTESVYRDAKFGFITAWALAMTGKTAEASTVLKAAMPVQLEYDPAYQLLITLEGPNALKLITEELVPLDRFEERPLIWAAYLLLREGKLEEAEATVRRAISIDPSDGEQGKGDRMRSYSVLAEIRAARGDQEEAKFFHDVVAAIRLSEEADRVVAAGLLSRGIGMYKESLSHFSQAYCIQSRLAIKLLAQGKQEEALVHYRKAYELMPDSFGRVESHCFGCEKAFAGEVQQGIAEQVFNEMAAATPEKPQVHYLLGYLRYEQDRPAEAYRAFRQAVALDPDYFNAWKKIDSVIKAVLVSPQERDAPTLNLIRLDPSGKRLFLYNTLIMNYPAVAQALESAQQQSRPTPEKLYPLAAVSEETSSTKAPQGALHQLRYNSLLQICLNFIAQ